MADKNEKISDEAEFYVNMFKYFADGPAGQKIIMLLTSDSDSSDFTYIRIMKKFSKNFNLSIHAVSETNSKPCFRLHRKLVLIKCYFISAPIA